MDKGRKLSLKRKTGSTAKPVKVISENNSSISQTKTINSIAEKASSVTVISSSEDDQSPHKEAAFLKQKHNDKANSSSGTEDESKCHNFLDVDPNLRQLRQMILQTFGKTQSEDELSLQDFPPLKSKESASIERTGQTNDSSEELSPFPPMCDRCRRSKSLDHSAADQTARNETKEKIQENTPHSSSGHSFHHQNPSKIVSENGYEMDHEDSALSSDHVRLNKCVNRHISGSANSSVAGSILKKQTASAGSKYDKSCSAGDGRAHTSNELKPRQLVTATRQVVPVTSHNFNNSHLMRDRNSNYYALQSRNEVDTVTASNQPPGGQSESLREENSTVSCIDVKINGQSRLNGQMLNGDDCDVRATKIRKTGDCSSTEKNHRLRVIQGCRVENDLTEQNKLTTSFPKQSCDTDKEEDSASSALYNGNHNQRSLHQSPSKPREAVGNHERSPTVEPVSLENISEIGSLDQVPASSTSVHENHESSKPENDSSDSRIKSCPLCQMEFEDSQNQVDIDGHIAVCLSATSDDVYW